LRVVGAQYYYRVDGLAVTGDLREPHPTVPTAPSMSLPIPNSNLNPNPNPNHKTKTNPNHIFKKTNPNPFFGKKTKRHPNIGRHRVIIIG